jgi:hypothetical protein
VTRPVSLCRLTALPLTARALTAAAGGPAPLRETTARVRDEPAPVYLRVGATLRVTAEPTRNAWQPLRTSDEVVLSCASAPGPDGAVDGTCRALRPGTATVTTSCGGHRWQLTVVVVT